MSVKKSKPYEINGVKTAFQFVDGKLSSIKESIDGVFTPIDPLTNKFAEIATSSDALNAYNVAKHGSNTDAYEKSVNSNSSAELLDFYKRELQKLNNQQLINNDTENTPSLAFSTPAQASDYYSRPITAGGSGQSQIMAYPIDISLNQDHMKITKYEYRRANINQSKPERQEKIGGTLATTFTPYGQDFTLGTVNAAGDSVKGSRIGGSIILPMPKATDVNGVEWGKSELTIAGLAGVEAANIASFGGRLMGKEMDDIAEDFKENMRRKRGVSGEGFKGFMSATYTSGMSKLASTVAGTDIDQDVILARTGGRVLNPNAEMLFQGPVIRDFSFEYRMIARSKKEGDEIRKIIRFLKEGMAPKFRNTTFLANPDVFQLAYKNGPGESDFLKTVNQFNPGGLALTTMNVDYAPNGYWSAYQDSQPVEILMSLNFTELRPIYQGDQQATPTDSVGF